MITKVRASVSQIRQTYPKGEDGSFFAPPPPPASTCFTHILLLEQRTFHKLGVASATAAWGRDISGDVQAAHS